ncbi:MAG: hypothetical protein ABIH23_01015 [bacterium]
MRPLNWPRFKFKSCLFALISVGLGFGIALLLLEIFFRFMPIAEDFNTLPVNDENPTIRSQPNQTLTWSRNWNFSIVNTIKINNYGFVNDHDYDPDATTPLLAVVGDSYVEAVMVPFEETIQGRLWKEVEPDGRVYSFAISGAPLSQYLEFARFARKEFKPDGYVFVVVGNDFDESISKYKCAEGYHHFFETDDGYELRRVDYTPSFRGKILRSSALGIYLFANLQAPSRLNRLSFKRQKQQFVGNVKAKVSEQRLTDSKKAGVFFLDVLPQYTGVEPSQVVFVLDGIRPPLYNPEELKKVEDSYWGQMRNFFVQEATSRGYEVIDMQPVFIESHENTGARFESPEDCHWNGTGHGVAAEAVRKSKVFAWIFGE